MKTQTLEELKQANEEEEAKLKAAETEEEEEETEQEDPEPEEEEKQEEESEGEEESEPEPWMQSDEQTSEEGQVPVLKHVKVKQKLKGKLKEKDEENQTLKEEIEDLKRQIQAPQAVTQDTPKPRRQDFQDKEDPDEAYMDALTDWKVSNLQKKQEQVMDSNRLEEEGRRRQEKIQKSVDQHYERAEQLVERHGIKPDAYQEADARIRQAIETVRPGFGDAITDQIISILGEGSEKALFYVGANDVPLAQLQSRLTSDKSGLSAIAFMTEVKATRAAQKSKSSRAPKPAPDVKGDSKPVASERKLKKAYQGATGQQRWDLRQQARKAGYNVDKW